MRFKIISTILLPLIMLLFGSCGRSTLQPREHDSGTETITDAEDAGDNNSVETDAGESDSFDAGDSVDTVEYHACEVSGSIERIIVQRIDRTTPTCVNIIIEENFGGSCLPLGLVSGGWCLSNATMGSDIAACEAMEPQSDAVGSIAATGMFTVNGHLMDIDVQLDFPVGGSLPETVHFDATDCYTGYTLDFFTKDCRR